MTEDQTRQLDKLQTEMMTQMRALRNEDTQPVERHEKMMALKDGLKSELESILTEEQIQKLEAVRSEKKQQFEKERAVMKEKWKK